MSILKHLWRLICPQFRKSEAAGFKQDLRAAVHEYRNQAQAAVAQARAFEVSSEKATGAAYQAIARLEEAKKARQSNEAPPD